MKSADLHQGLGYHSLYTFEMLFTVFPVLLDCFRNNLHFASTCTLSHLREPKPIPNHRAAIAFFTALDF